MSKFIIFCADGTWNGPGQDDNGDHEPDFTNVYKLFLGLAGAPSPGSIREADEQEKELIEGGQAAQVAKYIHGVGDSRNPVKKLFGGVFGSGIVARIVRGYTFISRSYEAGDAIVVVGFSRGAYTARALTGLIASQGVLAKNLTADKTEAYRRGAQAWYRYRKQSTASKPGFFQRLVEATADLPGFLSRDELKDSDLMAVDKIKAVAVWDTVGALGLPRYIDDERADAFKFTDTRLSPKIEMGFHAVALDEQRIDFSPTLWDSASNVVQVAFPGAHADVGGGYTTQENQSGLSDISLEWMVAQLEGIGVRFTRPIYSPFAPNPKGTAHKPWQHPPFSTSGKAMPRELKRSGIVEHPAVQQRVAAGLVVHEPGEAPAPYAPPNRL
jgi:glutathione S-transferase